MIPPLPPRALVLAPMVALSHRALRELILEFGGLDLAYTEMASAGAVASGDPFEDWYLDTGPEPERVVLQYFATKPERLPEALLRAAGRPAFGADINFGCSAPHITRLGGGAAWMREPERAFALARAARAAWTRPLSAKLRIGAEDDHGRLRDFARGLVEAGLDFLALHPRLEGQKLRRKSRWDHIGRLQAELPVPVIGNGDLRGVASLEARLREAREAGTEPAGLMIGREAVRRPWLFSLIRGREAASDFSLEVDLRATAFRFLELLEARLPPEFLETRAKRFFFYYTDNFSFGHHLKWRIQNAPDLAAIRAALDDYFAEMPSEARRRESD